jgi:hypothetical protein
MRSLLLAVAILAVAPSAHATRLFASAPYPVGPTGNLPAGLYEVDPATAAVGYIGPTPELLDISGRPGDPTHVYGVSRAGPGFRNVISAIDVDTGVVTEVVDVVPQDLGLAAGYPLELNGIAIHGSSPSTAAISAMAIDPVSFDTSMLFFDLDLETGAVSNVESVPGDYVQSLTYATDATLYGLEADPLQYIYTIDRSPLQLTLLADCLCAALEFDPDTGELLAVDRAGQLIRVSAVTGANLGSIGQTGLGGGSSFRLGLAFLPVPEPNPGILVAIGLVGYGLASKGRGGSRHTSRRA